MNNSAVSKFFMAFMFIAGLILLPVSAQAEDCGKGPQIDLSDEPCARTVLEALIWAGYYDGTIAKDVRTHVEEALRKFKDIKQPAAASLPAQDYDRLIRLAAEKKRTRNSSARNLSAYSIKLGVPGAYITDAAHPAKSQWGNGWTAKDTSFSEAILSYSDGRTLSQVFDRLTKIPNRIVYVSHLEKSWLLLTGGDGNSDFLVMMTASGDSLKGFSITYSRAMKARYARVAAAISLQFAKDYGLLAPIGFPKAQKVQPQAVSSSDGTSPQIEEATRLRNGELS